MKFIRDIIAEKRNASPAEALPSEIEEVIYPEQTSDEETTSASDEVEIPAFSDAPDSEPDSELQDAADGDEEGYINHAPSCDPLESEDDVPIDDQISGLLETLNRYEEPGVEDQQKNSTDQSVGSDLDVMSVLESKEVRNEQDDITASQEELSPEEPLSELEMDETHEISCEDVDPPLTEKEDETVNQERPDTGGISPVGMLKRSVRPTQDTKKPASDSLRARPTALTRSTTRLHTPDDEMESASDPNSVDQAPAPVTPIAVPRPVSARSGGRSGRVKTRILGFSGSDDAEPNPFSQPTRSPASDGAMYPVGWLIVIEGPGRGNAITLYDGVSQIGRGESQAVRLNFGDNSISRENHAAIAFDSEQNDFFIGHGGKANLVRLNKQPVLSTQKITSGDTVRIGETTLRFVGLCGPDFSWQET